MSTWLTKLPGEVQDTVNLVRQLRRLGMSGQSLMRGLPPKARGNIADTLAAICDTLDAAESAQQKSATEAKPSK